MRACREEEREEERRISDESRLLYAEAFGSISFGVGASAKSDSEVRRRVKNICKFVNLFSI